MKAEEIMRSRPDRLSPNVEMNDMIVEDVGDKKPLWAVKNKNGVQHEWSFDINTYVDPSVYLSSIEHPLPDSMILEKAVKYHGEKNRAELTEAYNAFYEGKLGILVDAIAIVDTENKYINPAIAYTEYIDAMSGWSELDEIYQDQNDGFYTWDELAEGALLWKNLFRLFPEGDVKSLMDEKIYAFWSHYGDLITNWHYYDLAG